MKRTTLSTALYVSLVFLSGAVLGGFAHRLYMMNSVFAGPASPKPEEVRRKILEEMRTKLSLSNDQVTQVNGILDSTRARYHEVKAKWDKEAKAKAKPELKAIQEDQIQKIKGILSEPQQVEYDKYRAERERLRRQQTAGKPPSS
jgi:hypothetical protein